MILVTGGTGMLGAHLLYKLVNSDEKVRATYRSEESLEKVKRVFAYYTDAVSVTFSKIEWVQADVTDLPSLEEVFMGVHKVFHVAALISFDNSDYKKMRAVNIKGTANIVNLCLAFSIEKLCFVSSIATLSKTIGKSTIDESDEFNLETSNYGYAITKHGAEMEVWRGAQEGLPVVVVNPGVILGPGYWNENSGALFSMVHRGFSFYSTGTTGFVGVDDVVAVMCKAMDSSVTNERFVLVSENLSFKTVMTLIANSFGVKAPRFKVNSFIAGIGWRLSWLKSKLTGSSHSFTKHAAKSGSNRSYYASEKAENTFNFSFEAMQSVIAKICEKFPEN